MWSEKRRSSIVAFTMETTLIKGDRLWRIKREENGYRVQYGMIEGKITETFHHVVAKSNRTIEEQIELECRQKIKKKMETGYHDSDGETLARVEPQLAWRAPSLDGLTDFPYWTQPKLDGIRGLVYIEDDQVVIQSRAGHNYHHLDHLRQVLRSPIEKLGGVVDGELMLPNHPFEDLVGAIRSEKERHPLNSSVEFNIFDVICDAPLIDRVPMLEIFYGLPNINVVTHTIVETPEELKVQYDRCMTDGFEGIMLRRADSMYTHGGRGKALIKYKESIDEEGTIVEVFEGNGREKGCAVFLLEDDLGVRFKCRPSGTFAERAKWYEDREALIGKRYTFAYQERSKDNVPRFPRGLRMRDYE